MGGRDNARNNNACIGVDLTGPACGCYFNPVIFGVWIEVEETLLAASPLCDKLLAMSWLYFHKCNPPDATKIRAATLAIRKSDPMRIFPASLTRSTTLAGCTPRSAT